MNVSKTPNVLVCVTGQVSSKKLIKIGADIAENCGASLQVLSVIPDETISENVTEIMQELFDEANNAGAEMYFYFNNSPAITAAVHATKTDTIHIVSGTPGVGSNFFIETIKGLLPELPLTLVDSDNKIITFPQIGSASRIKTFSASS